MVDENDIQLVVEELSEPIESKPSRKAKMIEVRVIQQQGASALVEYSKGQHLYRVILPSSSVVAGKASDDDLESGISQGLDFSEIVIPEIDAAALSDALHRRGVWSKEDILKNHQSALAVLQGLFVHPILVQLLKLAKESK